MGIGIGTETSRPRRIVIAGAGYGGLVTALKLQKTMRTGEMDVTLVNKHDYHYITTHLHVPAAGIESDDHARVRISDYVDTRFIRFEKASIVRIDPERKVVELEGGRKLDYDELVVGLGSETETFGIPGLAEHALAIRSLNGARMIRQHIAYMFAKYKREPMRLDYLTIVVGGAGFTGSEFIGELADRLPKLCAEFDIDPQLVRLYNVEAAPVALPPGLPAELVEYGMDVLRRKGVEYRIGTAIQACTPAGVQLSDGDFIRAATVIWSGGIRGNRLLEEAGFETKRGRVEVDAMLRSLQHPSVYVTGDCAIVMGAEGRPYPPTAQIAVQQGANVARNIAASIRGWELTPFNYDYKGTIASLGKGEAVGLIWGNRPIKGWFAALMKRVVDARYLFLLGGLPLLLRKLFFGRLTPR